MWLCYAERACTPETFEVTAPWARITLACGESAWPSVERLSDVVEPLGVQAVQPLETIEAAAARSWMRCTGAIPTAGSQWRCPTGTPATG